MSRRALITGITGQDGAYLAQELVEQGYAVYGAYRRSSTPNLSRLACLGIADRVALVPLDVLEITNVIRVLQDVRPDELYNLAAQSFVPLSFEQPIYTAEVNGIGTARILEAIRTVLPTCRFYQASTSEMFGAADESPQSERTPFRPRSPYAIAKAYAHWLTVQYREAFGLHASCGILFNHESPLRGCEFVTRKVTLGLARLRHGHGDVLELGNLDARRDWGFAGDYVRGMSLMIRREVPDDYVVATGEMHTVREWTMKAAEAAGFHLAWEREAKREWALDTVTGRTVVRTGQNFMRPADVPALCGDASKAHAVLGWQRDVCLDELIERMVRSDMDMVTAGRDR